MSRRETACVALCSSNRELGSGKWEGVCQQNMHSQHKDKDQSTLSRLLIVHRLLTMVNFLLLNLMEMGNAHPRMTGAFNWIALQLHGITPSSHCTVACEDPRNDYDAHRFH